VSAWIAAAIALIAVLISIAGIIFSAGQSSERAARTEDDVKQLNAAVVALRNTSEEEIKELRKTADLENREIRDGMHELLGALKEFTREQAAVNVGVTATLASCTERLQQVGDIVMGQKATIEIHGEILRRKGLISGD
jgi:hypothetical protein